MEQPDCDRPLTDFLVSLAEDLEKLEQYLASPQETLGGSGLSEEHQEILLSGDLHRIWHALEHERPDALMTRMVLLSPTPLTPEQS